MKIPPHQLGLDIDGVVADSTVAFIRLADEHFSIKVQPEKHTEFRVEECLDIGARHHPHRLQPALEQGEPPSEFRQ